MLGDDRIGEIARSTAPPPVQFPARPDQRDLGGRRRRLISPYRYEWREGGIWYRLTAPAGFEHDGASVPRFVWSFYAPHPLDRAAVFHDLLYQRLGELERGEWQWSDRGIWRDVAGRWTRGEADRLFRRQLDEDPEGPGRVRRAAAYRGVQIGGRWVWRRRERAAAVTSAAPVTR